MRKRIIGTRSHIKHAIDSQAAEDEKFDAVVGQLEDIIVGKWLRLSLVETGWSQTRTF